MLRANYTYLKFTLNKQRHERKGVQYRGNEYGEIYERNVT